MMQMNNAKRRILCVDDDISTCKLVTHILKEFEIVYATSRAEAFKLSAAEQFDLVLLDYRLPDGNGLMVCRFIREFNQHTPILFCTAYAEINEQQALAAGTQDLIIKGLTCIDALQMQVSKLLPDSC